MSHWLAIKRRARKQHSELSKLTNGDLSAKALLFAADEITKFTRTSVPADDPLLYGADAVLDSEVETIWFNESLPSEVAHYYQAHEYAHHWLHSGQHDCSTSDINDGELESDVPVGIQLVKAYSPRERREREANVFARELLLPANNLRSWYVNEKLRASDIAKKVGLPITLVLHQLSHALLTVEANEQDQKVLTNIDDLDKKQRQAARISHGPFLLDAGPGTGKTKTLIGRILYLLKDKGVPATDILALTFSRRAADEMRDRISQAAPEDADNIWIGTFHAFGLELLQKFGAVLNLPPKIVVIDPIQSLLILEQKLPSLQLNYYQDLYDPTRNLADILGAISRAKDELISPTKYLELANTMYDTAVSTEALVHAEKIQEVGRVYAIYQDYLIQNNLLDFGDLIARAVELLCEDTNVQAQIQTQYPHILVDEYQDVNLASRHLLREMSGNGTGLWVVGDERQSIYRFRGASPSNIRFFTEDFTDAQVDSLVNNYRSQLNIVTLFSEFAQQMPVNRERNSFTWKAKRQALKNETILSVAENKEDEISTIIDEIQRRITQGTQYSDQAILCRVHSQLADLAVALEEAGIPALYLGNLFEREEIRDLLSLLTLITDQNGHGLIRVGSFHNYAIPMEDISVALAVSKENVLDIPTLLADGEILKISPGAEVGFSRLHQDLQSLGLESSTWSVLVLYLFEYSDYLYPLLDDESIASQQKKLAVFQLIQLTASQENFLDAEISDPIADFLQYIRRLESSGANRQLRHVLDSGVGINAVRLLTVHAAKGLEFDTVYLPFLGKGKFPIRKQSTACPPPTGMLPDNADNWHIDEEESLFFVALSRARNAIVLSRAKSYSHGNRVSNPSDFLGRIDHLLSERPKGNIPRGSTATESSYLSPQADPTFSNSQTSFHVRQLDTYLRCPRQYYYDYDLGLKDALETIPYARFYRCVSVIVDDLRTSAINGNPVEVADARQHLAEVWQNQGPVDHSLAAVFYSQAEAIIFHAASFLSHLACPISRPEWKLSLDGKSLYIRPDLVEERLINNDRQTVVTCFKRRRPTKSEADKNIYALYQEAAARSFPTTPIQIQILWLATGDIEVVSMSNQKIKTRLNRYQTAIAGIVKSDFAQNPDDFLCPRCPYYFICPSP